MFDLDAGKLLIIGIVALVVIGPKELPRVLRQVGQAVGKLRRMAADFQGQFMDAMKEADIEDLKKEITSLTDSAKAEVNSISDAAKIDINFDPVNEIKNDMTAALDGTSPSLGLPPLPETPAVTAEAIAPAPEAKAARRTKNADAEAVSREMNEGGRDTERVPYRKRVAYTPGRVARAARRDAEPQ